MTRADAGMPVSRFCLAEQIGLTTLYNAVDDGAYVALKALHRELDEADIVRRLTALNREITEGRSYDPFTHLGQPAT